MGRLEFQLKLQAPVEAVWHAWTDSETITKWFSPEAYIEPRLGGAYELYFDPDDHDHMSTKGCKITKIQPTTHLSFQWRGPDQYLHVMNDPEPATHVHIEFQEEGVETTITVIHEGWGTGQAWDEAREWHKKAWEGVLKDLQKFSNKK